MLYLFFLYGKHFGNIELLLSGSFHTASKHTLPIWYETAKLVFNQTKEDDFVKKSGAYDRIIIDCAFRENLLRKKRPTDDGGCADFEPSLTTNGMCYTFNGEHTSELWKASQMMTTFSQLFPSKIKSNIEYPRSRQPEFNLAKSRKYEECQVLDYCWFTA